MAVTSNDWHKLGPLLGTFGPECRILICYLHTEGSFCVLKKNANGHSQIVSTRINTVFRI